MLTILLLYFFSLKREARVTGNVEFLQGKQKKKNSLLNFQISKPLENRKQIFIFNYRVNISIQLTLQRGLAY